MKALMLAAVMALGGTGVSALDTNTLLTKGTVIAVLGFEMKNVWVSFEGKIYVCVNSMVIECWSNENTDVIE